MIKSLQSNAVVARPVMRRLLHDASGTEIGKLLALRDVTAGMNDHIAKPVAPGKLYETLLRGLKKLETRP